MGHMTSNHKKPGVALWATVVVVVVLVLVIYPLSYGPARVLAVRHAASGNVVRRIYSPARSFAESAPDCVATPFIEYVGWWRNDQEIRTLRKLRIARRTR